jgi:hypothetical protein
MRVGRSIETGVAVTRDKFGCYIGVSAEVGRSCIIAPGRKQVRGSWVAEIWLTVTKSGCALEGACEPRWFEDERNKNEDNQ